MNKKGQQNGIGDKIILVIIAFILSGVVIYFLGNIAIWIGFASLAISGILFYVASQTNKEDVGYAALFFLITSIILLLVGFAIVLFFENNEVGKIWLGGGKEIINTTANTYKTLRGT